MGCFRRISVGPALFVLAAGLALSPTTRARQEAAPAPPLWTFITPGGADAALLASRRDELNRTLNLYNYPPLTAGWQVQRLQSEWLSRYAVFHLQSPESDPRSEYNLVLAAASGPPPTPARTLLALALVPLVQNGQGDPDPETDPHNYALFNASLAADRPLPTSTAGWVEWSRVYLELTGCRDELITAANIAGRMGPRASHAQYLPYVFAETRGWTGVQFYTASTASGARRLGAPEIVEYGFEFDDNGLLRNLIPVAGSRADPPPPLAGVHP